jgi:hypothetical protein
MPSDKRRSPRESIALAARVTDGCLGWTKNISATGVLLELDGDSPVAGEMDFEIHLDTADGPFRLVAHGRVVRCQELGSRRQLAVELMTSRLESGM